MRPTLLIRPTLVIAAVVSALLLLGIAPRYYPVGGHIVQGMMNKSRPQQLPLGGKTIFPRYRFVALYGTPGAPELGALGSQDALASSARVHQLAAQYAPLFPEIIQPTWEIIATVASASPTDDGDYSYTVNTDTLQQWVQVAHQQGIYVVLDLQPGRTSFVAQAQQFAALLAEPNVGLALDPEWRLKPDQKPLEQIGSVSIQEVNDTAAWLADLTARHHLPQKLFVLHQFRLDMLPNRQLLDTLHPELAYIIQMDGQGTQAAKLDTWRAVTATPPSNLQFGWKNFYTKDSPTRSAEDTAGLQPSPWYISYQ